MIISPIVVIEIALPFDHVNYLGYVLDKAMSGETMTNRVTGKIKSTLNSFIKKISFSMLNFVYFFVTP